MSRYIDADAAIDLIRQYSFFDGNGESVVPEEILLSEIKRQPTADVAPVRHGKWIFEGLIGFVCSECKEGYRDQPTLMGKPMFDYCPICGAKMDGGEDAGRDE